MTRSPNYGRRRSRPKHRRSLYLLAVERDDGAVRVILGGDGFAPFAVAASDDTSAIVKVEMLRQGAWSVPVNGRVR